MRNLLRCEEWPGERVARRVTMQKLAEELQLSRSSISRALAGEKGVSESTRAQVNAAARRFGYRGDVRRAAAAAQVILLAESATLREPVFWAPVLGGLAEELLASGGSLSIAVTERAAPALVLPPALAQVGHINGVIAIHRTDPRAVAAVRARGLPLVLVNYQYDDLGADLVMSDDDDGGYQVGVHLFGRGHRRFGFLGDTGNRSFGLRYEGYCRALRQRGVPLDQVKLWATPADLPRETGDLPSALFCCNDQWAVRTVHELRSRGVAIPGDVALAGFDDSTFQIAGSPVPLTSVRVHPEELGRWGARLLEHRLTSGDLPPVRLLVRTELVVRESTGS